MKHIILTIILFTSLFLQKEVPQLEDSVYILTDQNAEDFINKEEFVFVKFYAPWCGHCKKMAPEFRELGAKFNTAGQKVRIAKVDSTVHKSFSEKYKIEGFPTLKLFINGEPIDYQGERTKNAMMDFIEKKSNQKLKIAKTREEVHDLKKKPFAVVLLIPEGHDEHMRKAMILSKDAEDYEFIVVHDPSFIPHGVQEKAALIVFRNFDEGDKVIEFKDNDVSINFIKSFIKEHKYPIVSTFDQDSANRIFGEHKPAFFFFDDNHDTRMVQEFKKFAKESYAENKDMIFSVSTISSGFGQKLADYLAVPKDQSSARIVQFVDGDLLKYKVEDLSFDGFVKAMKDYKAKSLKPYFKSDPIPRENNEPVKVIVADMFDDFVLNGGKFVLVEGYAPWCGHCKSLEPVYKELAEHFLPLSDKIVIGKMDGTTNEHAKFPVKGFPTIRLFKPGQANYVEYEGGRTLNDFISFIKKETGLEVAKVAEEKVKEDLSDASTQDEL